MSPLRNSIIAIVMALAGLLAGPARADRGVSTTKALPKNDRGAGIVGAKIGGLFTQPFSPLGASYLVEVEAGYLMPWVHRLLSVTASLAFTSPGTSGSGEDPRLPGGMYSYSMTEQQLILGLTLTGKIPLGRVVPYLGLGPRFFFVRTLSSGQAGGVPIPETRETATEIGVGMPLGVDILLGPGRLFAEGQLLYSPTGQRSTGPGSLGALALMLGYRFVL
jgi:hypothetical protein